ncbi:MAG TPA: GAF and ANTAR domain-containing protein [Nocardioidaceae bacterium]|nr:GAF and ANTAR domain-containing protein [Nocardioidaceae bacterium]
MPGCRTPSADPTGGATASLFRGLAKLVYDCDDYAETYRAICEASPTLVHGCDHASLMLASSRGRYETVAASDDIAARVDELEREIGDGPCVDAIKDEAATLEPTLLQPSRWPRLAAQVINETPVRSMAGFRLLVDSHKVGALNLFSDTPNGFTEQSVNQGAVVTSFISVALLAAHQKQAAASLRNGLESNREIGKAVGLMMAFHKVDDEAAFGMLRKASQDMNIKLAEVARQFVAHHNSRP